MQLRRSLLGALAALLALAVPAHAQAANPYVNPFTDPAWLPARTDMGVDWIPTKPVPVLAIGDARIIGSLSHDRGWPGHHFMWYQLLDGSHAGDIIYVAEHLKNMVPAGTTVSAGQQIATALPGSPYTEWGWAELDGATRAAPCYHEGQKTNSGREMARFMQSLGATVRNKPGPGPDFPTGRLC